MLQGAIVGLSKVPDKLSDESKIVLFAISVMFSFVGIYLLWRFEGNLKIYRNTLEEVAKNFKDLKESVMGPEQLDIGTDSQYIELHIYVDAIILLGVFLLVGPLAFGN